MVKKKSGKTLSSSSDNAQKKFSIEEIRKKALQDLNKLEDSVNNHYKDKVLVSGKKKGRHSRRISSGVFSLDYSLGGGVPMHRVTAFFGKESTSKTTLALLTMANAQKINRETLEYIPIDIVEKGYILDEETNIYVDLKSGEVIQPMRCAFIDLEGSFDDDWYAGLGGNPNAVRFAFPNSGEGAVDIVQNFIKSGAIDFIVVDSIAMMSPLKEIEAAAGDQDMGLQARLINKACRKWASEMNKITDIKKKPTIIVINQLRQKIGVMFGNPETLPGGLGQKFLSSCEVKTSKGKVEHLTKTADSPLWIEMKGECVKNKTAPPKIPYSFNLALNDYTPPEEGDKKYPIPFRKGEVLEHKQVATKATQYKMIGKDEESKKYFVQLINERFEYDKKGDLLNEWIYFDKDNYRRLKEDLIQVMRGNV